MMKKNLIYITLSLSILGCVQDSDSEQQLPTNQSSEHDIQAKKSDDNFCSDYKYSQLMYYVLDSLSVNYPIEVNDLKAVSYWNALDCGETITYNKIQMQYLRQSLQQAVSSQSPLIGNDPNWGQGVNEFLTEFQLKFFEAYNKNFLKTEGLDLIIEYQQKLEINQGIQERDKTKVKQLLKHLSIALRSEHTPPDKNNDPDWDWLKTHVYAAVITHQLPSNEVLFHFILLSML